MRSRFLTLIAVAAVFTTAACSMDQDMTPVPYQPPFTLTANDREVSKTTLNDDYSVDWSNKDSISVFNAEAGSASYSGNLIFKISDVQSGAFTPAAGIIVPFEDGKLYDWYVYSPYQKWCTSPKNGGSVTLAGTQTQVGNNSSSHIFENDIMVGKATATRTPAVVLDHLGTLMKFTVKNVSPSAASITKIKVDAGETVIAGAYKVDLTSDLPEISSSGMGSSSYTSVTLNVNGGDELAVDASADFYLMLAPFTVAAGNTISITVEGTNGSFTKSLTPVSDLSFGAGKYNTATINYEGDPLYTPTKFTVQKSGGIWKLYKWIEGVSSEFFIKGGAANNFYSKIDDFGGNVLRTYSITTSTSSILTQASEAGAYVIVGVAIGRETDGFDYNDEDAVAAQFESVKSQIQQYKGYSSILAWSIGNEADASYTNTKLWSAINDIAGMIHEEDPNHPVTTALAGVKESAVKELITMAPNIDFLSINSYYAATSNVQSNLSSYGWVKPWILTEFGPRGTWALSAGTEPPLTSWGACVEQTSTEKAAIYKTILDGTIMANKDNGCLGSCAFVWGYQKHGAVLTWYGLFDKNGYSFGAVDELVRSWTGSYPAKMAPVIADRDAITMNGLTADDDITVNSGSSNTASVTASSPCGAALTYKWLIYKEGTSASDGSLPDGISGLITDASLSEISFHAPSAAGNYRLVVFAKDDVNKKIASAVIPFQVTDDMKGSTPGWGEGNISWN